MTTELDDLRRELAEARAVLADFLAERRPADSWVMALVGAGFALKDFVKLAENTEHDGYCGYCSSDIYDGCDRSCLRSRLVLVAPDTARLEFDRSEDAAYREDRRRFPMYGPPNRPSPYDEIAEQLLREVYPDALLTELVWPELKAVDAMTHENGLGYSGKSDAD